MDPSFLLKFATLINSEEFSIEHDRASDLDGLLYFIMFYTKKRGIDASKLLYYIERHYYASSLEAEKASRCKWWLVQLVFLVAFMSKDEDSCPYGLSVFSDLGLVRRADQFIPLVFVLEEVLS